MEKVSKNKESNVLHIMLGTAKFYRVSRPCCTPPGVYTFALNKDDAVLKVAKKYGGVANSKAREIKVNGFVS